MKFPPGARVRVTATELKELRGKLGVVLYYDVGHYWVEIGDDIVPFEPRELSAVKERHEPED